MIPQEQATYLTTPEHLLVVDDEENLLVALREALSREGYQVVTCTDPLQGLHLVQEQGFSVILADHAMPNLTGLEFLSQVKALLPDATRILLTPVLSLSTALDAVNKGEIFRFVVKPWLREELLATVRNAVQRFELVCANKDLAAQLARATAARSD